MTGRQTPVVVPRMPQSQPAISAGQIVIPVIVQSTASSQAATQAAESSHVVTTHGEEATVAVVTITASSTANPPMFVQSSPVMTESAMISAAADQRVKTNHDANSPASERSQGKQSAEVVKRQTEDAVSSKKEDAASGWTSLPATSDDRIG